MTEQNKIRNFSIIAHIDHGKSTLSDRLIELCDAVPEREMESQLLDNMDLERERGITIKARAVRLTIRRTTAKPMSSTSSTRRAMWTSTMRSPAPWPPAKGAILVVDAAQGIEAQTLANTYLALEHDLEILPVVNKIDLPAADPQKVKEEIETSSASRPGRPGDLRQDGPQHSGGAGGYRGQCPRPLGDPGPSRP